MNALNAKNAKHIVTLRDPSSSVAAQFVPDAGMIGSSLTDLGVQLLGQRRGLDTYIAEGKTMGIPILYPWANRLGSDTYTAQDMTVTLTPGETVFVPIRTGCRFTACWPLIRAGR